jgi:hypothetical protein
MIVKCPRCWVTVTLTPTVVAQVFMIQVLDGPKVLRQRLEGRKSHGSCEVLNRALAEAVTSAVRAARSTPLMTTAMLDE